MSTVFAHFYDCVPPKTTAQQHKRIFRSKAGKMFLGTDAKGKAVQSELAAIFLSCTPPESFPRDRPVMAWIRFYYPYRKTEKRGLVKRGERIPHTSKPDLDNLCKGCADVLTRCGFWNDDSQVYSMSLEKYWAPRPGIEVVLRVV